MCPIVRDWHSYTGGQQGIAPTDAPLKAVLKRSYEGCLAEANGDHTQARQMFPSHIQCDRRLDGFDSDRLAAEFQECYDTGKHLDLERPELKPGGQPREQNLKTSSIREGHTANTVKAWK